jgi:putative ABC transport system permease protein
MISEIGKAQEKLNDAPTPEWFYFTRKNGISYDSYYQDTLRLQQIGYVFPLVFFLVAILVSLTTMSRMVEEHRTQIGIYKALGYTPLKSIIKYMFYAFSASITGGIAGVIAGSKIFPRIIADDAYAYLYRMPPVETPVPVFISLIAVSSATGAILLVTLLTCLSSIYGAPAELMRPKSPPAGKRVLIERFGFIWNRLGFISKVTARNIFRYKKRFIMTLIGVAGCSALLVTAFGLRDSISGVDVMQYERIVKYSSRSYLKDIADSDTREKIDALLSGSYLYIREESVTAKNNTESFSASLIVPEIPEDLNIFINLRERKTGKDVPFNSHGVLLTEKLAREIGVSVGDNFNIIVSGGRSYAAQVTGIAENYVLHYIYISPDIYFELFGEEPLFNGVLAINNAEDERKSAERLLANDNVRAVSNTEDVKKNLGESTDALQIVTAVLIILACALAFIVLFNLTNINITERIRELATIKVLGFYDAELAMYIYRENALVSIMGIFLGLAGGVWLHRYVLTAAEIDMLMFPQIIKAESFIFSFALSVIFTLFVNLVMNFKLIRIDMVESLKNVE